MLFQPTRDKRCSTALHYLALKPLMRCFRGVPYQKGVEQRFPPREVKRIHVRVLFPKKLMTE